MLRDTEIIIYNFDDNRDKTIIPISDVHLGAAEHLEKEWKDFCVKLQKSEDTYITLGGDMINNATRSSVSNVFEEVMRPREQKKRIAEMLMPIKDKILCAVGGNHERRSVKDADDNPMYDIMCWLDKEHLYRENIAFCIIRFGEGKPKPKNGMQNPYYCICVTHGSGGGALSGSTINKNERFGYVLDGVDALIVGHSHKPIVSAPMKIQVFPQNNQVIFKQFKVISCSSWLAWGGYAASKMLAPQSNIPQYLTLSGNRKNITVTM